MTLLLAALRLVPGELSPLIVAVALAIFGIGLLVISPWLLVALRSTTRPSDAMAARLSDLRNEAGLDVNDVVVLETEKEETATGPLEVRPATDGCSSRVVSSNTSTTKLRLHAWRSTPGDCAHVFSSFECVRSSSQDCFSWPLLPVGPGRHTDPLSEFRLSRSLSGFGSHVGESVQPTTMPPGVSDHQLSSQPSNGMPTFTN